VQNHWGQFHAALTALAPNTPVHFLIRGWDGLTTRTNGLEHFLRRYQGHLTFTFVCRASTHHNIIGAFRDWWSNNAIAGAAAVERAMHARIHATFTGQNYAVAQGWYPGLQPAMMDHPNGLPTLCLLHI
jgi:hypothetical protein